MMDPELPVEQLGDQLEAMGAELAKTSASNRDRLKGT